MSTRECGAGSVVDQGKDHFAVNATDRDLASRKSRAFYLSLK
jgi:hypothetical protein